MAYPHSVTRSRRVVNDEVAGRRIVVFHGAGAVTAVGEDVIREAREIGTTGVFSRELGGRALTFRFDDGRFVDHETGSTWGVTGRATEGPLAGHRLTPVPHGNVFSFAWRAFQPGTKVYQPVGEAER